MIKLLALILFLCGLALTIELHLFICLLANDILTFKAMGYCSGMAFRRVGKFFGLVIGVGEYFAENIDSEPRGVEFLF